MIILNHKDFNNNFDNNIKIYSELTNFGYLECPCCGSDNLIRWGSYNRYVMYKSNNHINFEIVTIYRLFCKNCGHTHALIPSFIIPYRQMLSDVIISIITDDEILLNYNFSMDTISYIKNLFNKEAKSFLLILSKKLKYSSFLHFLTDTNTMYYNFYLESSKIFMMKHKGCFNMAYFKIGLQHNNPF